MLRALLVAVACCAEGPEAPVVSLLPEPLTVRGFQPFGQVIEVPEGMAPTIGNAVLSYWGGLARTRLHEDTEFGLFTVKAREREVAEMERHARSPELLVSLTTDCILVVAPPTPPKAGAARPDVRKVKAFTVPKGTALILAKGTWHALPFPLEPEAKFLVGFRNGTAKKDLALRQFKDRAVVKF